MAAPQSTQLPDAPQRNYTSEDDFVNKANAFTEALEPFRQQLQAQADFVDEKVVDLDEAVTAAEAARDAAANSAASTAGVVEASEAARDAAAQSATEAEVNKIAALQAKSAAEAARDSASQISGLDTVEDAVDAALPTAPALLDGLRRSVEAASGGLVTVLYDTQGNANYMRVIPKFRYEDLGLQAVLGTGLATAFTSGGNDISELFIGCYAASAGVGGVGISAPMAAPLTGIDYNGAKAACTAKGSGWHLMSAHEWAAIALWCKVNGTIPRGNTNYGRAHDATHETAIRTDAGTPGVSSGTGSNLSGTGPVQWRHDHTTAGISDLVGNVWEWQDQLKIIDGEIFCTTDNDYTAAEASWQSAGHFLNNVSGTLTLANTQGTPEDAGIDSEWNALAKAAGYTEGDLMKRLMVSPQTETGAQGKIYANTSGERLPCRGGRWVSGSSAGLGALHLLHPRSHSSSPFVFRPAFAN